ncbi:MAG: hypothetical protein JWP81_1808 [Ferruginibacter sp.]|nr:hypothetical protein [Ferruginibacter sp.]
MLLIPGTFLMIVIMAKTGAQLKTPANPKGIIGLELAYNAGMTKSVITDWVNSDPNNLSAVRINTYFDFAFIFFYSFLLSTLCALIAPSVRGLLSSAGSLLAKGVLLAGLTDVLENFGMLISLQGYISDTCTLFTFIFSMIKWILVFAALGYIIIAGSFSLIRKGRKQG